MKGYQNGTGAVNSDVIRMAFVFDGLAASEKAIVYAALVRNCTGGVNKTFLNWTSSDWTTLASPYLLGLPEEAIRAIRLLTWTSSLSHPELLAAPPPPGSGSASGRATRARLRKPCSQAEASL